jgi:hypothetical protein
VDVKSSPRTSNIPEAKEERHDPGQWFTTGPGLTRDDVLDNIAIAWLTNTALSGARLYWENWGKVAYFGANGVPISVAVSVFPDEIYPAPRSWAEQAYPKLIHYNRLPKGGHFAAFEQPKLLPEEIRVGLRSLRSAMAKAAA